MSYPARGLASLACGDRRQGECGGRPTRKPPGRWLRCKEADT